MPVYTITLETKIFERYKADYLVEADDEQQARERLFASGPLLNTSPYAHSKNTEKSVVKVRIKDEEGN